MHHHTALDSVKTLVMSGLFVGSLTVKVQL